MSIIAQIKEQMTIGKLLQLLRIEVNRSGHIFSPYKEEKTASCKIYFNTNSYRCYATNQGGDIIDFWMAFYNCDKNRAINDLANICGIENNPPKDKERAIPGQTQIGLSFQAPAPVIIHRKFWDCIDPKIKTDLSETEYELFLQNLKTTYNYGPDHEVEYTEEFKNELLLNVKRALLPARVTRLEKNKEIFREFYNYCISLPGDKAFWEYLINVRKLNPRLLTRFKIFFVLDYQKCNNHMKKKFDLESLKRSGLYNKNGNLLFYTHRLIIPYLHNKEIIYLRGRYFDEHNNTDGEGNKYLGLVNDVLDVNSPKRFFNMDVFHTMMPGEKLFIVEGEFDTIALESLLYNAIGIPGAGNIPDEVKFDRLLKYNIHLCGDNDTTGKIMIEKILDIFLNKGKSFSIINLSDKDINSFVAA